MGCLEASVAYQRLAALLRGEFPPNILPATPSGYLVARIHQLAEGHCMPAFTWNGGGEWKGKSWSPELPTDSALMFYLFASYLAAPQWFFLQDEVTAVTSVTGTLYLVNKLTAAGGACCPAQRILTKYVEACRESCQSSL
jgi:hypothetical protein